MSWILSLPHARHYLPLTSVTSPREWMTMGSASQYGGLFTHPDTATQAGRCREGRHFRTPFWNYVEQPNRDLSNKRPKGVSCGGGHRCGTRCPRQGPSANHLNRCDLLD